MAVGSPRPFLTAQWLNLVLINYVVDESILTDFVPPGCELDRLDGHSYASLVAFDFRQTRVLGVRWPGFTNFPEINLRIYVRFGDIRGVVFVRELVPSRLVAAIARWLYNEPYERAKMKSAVRSENEELEVEHRFRLRGAEHRIHASVGKDLSMPTASGTEHFFKEHEHGFGRSRSGERVHYRVTHPLWRTRSVLTHSVSVDFGAIYGDQWRVLSNIEPSSVVFAEGSEVKVYPASKLA